MVCAVDHDPLVAVVRHSSVRDIGTVIVNGVVLKYDGNLTPIDGEGEQGKSGGCGLWKEVAAELKRSRAEIQERIENLDMEVGKKGQCSSSRSTRIILLKVFE